MPSYVRFFYSVSRLLDAWSFFMGNAINERARLIYLAAAIEKLSKVIDRSLFFF